MKNSKTFRVLDEARIGLLVRMSFHRACVCSKKIQMPLLRRGWTENTRDSLYELTTEGKKAAKRFVEEYEGKPLRTYGGISIGTEVMIVNTK